MRRPMVFMALIALLAAIPGPAAAATGWTDPTVSVVVKEVHLVGKTLAKVDVAFSCTLPQAPRGYDLDFQDGGIVVDVHQASGRRIASAEGGHWLTPEACDGAVHEATISVTAHDNAFKFGRALVDVEAYMVWEYWRESDEDWGYLGGSDTTGWVTVRMHKR